MANTLQAKVNLSLEYASSPKGFWFWSWNVSLYYRFPEFESFVGKKTKKFWDNLCTDDNWRAKKQKYGPSKNLVFSDKTTGPRPILIIIIIILVI